MDQVGGFWSGSLRGEVNNLAGGFCFLLPSGQGSVIIGTGEMFLRIPTGIRKPSILLQQIKGITK